MRIKDICSGVTDGSHNPPQGLENSDYLMLSSKNVFDDKITFDSPRYLSQIDFEQESKRTRIKSGDVLLTIVGTVGRAAVVGENMPQFTLQRSVAVLHPNVEICDSRYLMYALQANRNHIESRAKGVAQKGIYLKEVADIELQIPLLSEQTHRVKVLDKIAFVIKFRQQQLQKLDELVKARFVELFGDPLHNTKDLQTSPMTNICRIIDGDRGKNYPKQEDFSDCGFCLFLNAKNVTAQGFSFENCMYITEEKDALLHNGKLCRGDVILTTRGTIGNLAFYDTSVPYGNVRINSGMVILRMDRNLVSEIFFMEQFKMQLDSIKSRIASGSAQPQLPISTMNKIKMILPQIELQKQFEQFVKQIDKSKVAVQKSLDEAQLLFDSLMQQYFG